MAESTAADHTGEPPAGFPAPHRWHRFVALGDSFTEGVGDPDPGRPGGLRGWADRVAEELGAGQKDFAYANLAVRGLLLQQIFDQQIGPALALTPDLVTLSAGGNDVVFRRSDPDRLAEKLDAGVTRLSAGGATLVLFAGPDWGTTAVLGAVRGKVAVFNENLHAIAARHGAVVVDLWCLRQLRDPRMWDPDRIHLSPLGHHSVAALVLETLGVPHTPAPALPGTLPGPSRRKARAEDILWAREYMLPWMLQRLRPRPTRPGLQAKRPRPAPIGGGSPSSPFIPGPAA